MFYGGEGQLNVSNSKFRIHFLLQIGLYIWRVDAICSMRGKDSSTMVK